MALYLSPISMVLQYFDNSGIVLANGQIWIYDAGTSTLATTFTDVTGNSQNTNPIVLDAAGRLHNVTVWQSQGVPVKIVVTDQSGNQIGPTFDQVYGINDPANIGVVVTVPQVQDLINTAITVQVPPLVTSSINSTVTANYVGNLLYSTTANEAAASVQITNFAYPPGDIRRYGASATNSDNGPAINNALLCNSIVFDGNNSGPVIYPVKTTIRFRAAGQTFRGAGYGDNNLASAPAPGGPKFAPRTTLKWTGIAGSSVVSVSDGTVNWSETTLSDLCIDGNALANKGVEGYDDTINTGCWRNSYHRVTVINCTNGANPTAIYLGNNGGGFANDNYLQQCYLWNCGIGIWSNGAVTQLFHCTIGVMAQFGMYLPGNGAEAKCYGGVFHANNSDVDVAAAGVIQNISFFGTWFENSTVGILTVHNSYNAQFIGCHFHTSSATYLINCNGQAGHLTVKCWVPANSASFAIINPNPQYDYDIVGTGITVAGGYKLKIKGSNGFADIDNAKFSVSLTNTTGAITGNGTAFSLNNLPVTKNYDLAGAVAAGTGIFTAPVSGFYRFTIALEIAGVTSSHNDAQLNLVVLGTSAQTYLVDRRNPGSQTFAGSSESRVGGSILVPMTAGDTCFPSIIVSGGTLAVSVLSGNTSTNYRTVFSGQFA